MYNNNTDNNKVDAWRKYEAGIQYNQRLKPNYYEQINSNIAMYNGDHWRNLKSTKLPAPVFNFIKRGVLWFVSTLTANKIKIIFEPLAYSVHTMDQNELIHKGVADIATSEVENLFDKFKMDQTIQDALITSAVMGDMVCHMYFDITKAPYGQVFPNVKGEICFELLDGTSLHLGNPNNPSMDVHIQPYIIISGRDVTENLKREAKLYKQNETEANNITEDSNYEYEAGDNARIESDETGKSQYIIMYIYDYDTKTVKATKCVQNVYIYKDIDTGLSYYPVALGNWEKSINSFHGKSPVTEATQTQLFINKMFAMVFYHMSMSAFPKLVYDADKVNSMSNEIGVAIGLKNLQPNENVRNIAAYLEPGNMSIQIMQIIEMSKNYLNETMGISDAAMGNVNPDNYRALAVATENAKQPLTIVRNNLYTWIEDIGKILLDMMGTYYGERPIVVSDPKGNKQLVNFNFDELKNVYLNTKCEVGATSFWSELSSTETLGNLLKDGHIDIISYLEALPDNYLNNKQQIIDAIKQKQEMEAQLAQQQAMSQQAISPQIPQ
jgi:hypothetical protein